MRARLLLLAPRRGCRLGWRWLVSDCKVCTRAALLVVAVCDLNSALLVSGGLVVVKLIIACCCFFMYCCHWGWGGWLLLYRRPAACSLLPPLPTASACCSYWCWCCRCRYWLWLPSPAPGRGRMSAVLYVVVVTLYSHVSGCDIIICAATAHDTRGVGRPSTATASCITVLVVVIGVRLPCRQSGRISRQLGQRHTLGWGEEHAQHPDVAAGRGRR